TAGSGKSLLTSILKPWYSGKGATAITANLDPGAFSLPYAPDVDVREYIDLQSVMESYQLGPNGALIFASDMIASRLPDIQDQIDTLNPDYVIFDTPGQVELFAYRQSGPYFIENFTCDARSVIFLFDSMLVSTASNFVSIALLAASLQLRLKSPQVPVLSKRDMGGDQWKKIMKWSTDLGVLEDALAEEKDSTNYLLSSSIFRDLVKVGFAYEQIPVSSVTQEGMIELSATLSRILRGGEEVED
ncbi:MAG: ATP/GTP-binding protein, partial [Nitrososphaerales archaeon]